MNDFHHILKQAQKIISCPICKRRYQLNEIKLRGFIDNTYIFQVNCNNSHTPIAMTMVFSSEPVNKELIKGIISTEKIKSNKIDNTKIINIEKLKQNLIGFDGDFEKLWKK